jgi:hypothetical protein
MKAFHNPAPLNLLDIAALNLELWLGNYILIHPFFAPN